MDRQQGSAEFLVQISEELRASLRSGERPDVDHYTERYPQYADEIKRLFESLLAARQAGPDDLTLDAPRGDHAGGIAQPHKLGDYRILREIGRGGMGIVYEAEQESLGRRVALKVLPAHALMDPKHLQRFHREARAVARLHHTNIVPVYGVGHNDGIHYYVMQFIRGQGLDAVISEIKELIRPHGELRPIVDGVAELAPSGTMAHGLLTGFYYTGNTSEQTESSAEHNSAVPTDAHVPPGLDTTTVFEAPRPVGGLDTTSEFTPGEELEESSPHDGARTDAGYGTLQESAPRPMPRSHSARAAAETVIGRRDETETSGKHRGAARRTYWHSVARIGRQVADALEYSHSQGTVHRDIKPSNLLVDPHGTVWLTDFGLAKGNEQENLTQTGDILGTLRYMAPEAIQGEIGPSIDIYALGLTLFELAGLEPARNASARNDLLRQVTQGDVPRLRTFAPDIPHDLETIIHKTIDADPRRRYATAGMLAADLGRFLSDEPILARRIGPLERLTRWSRRNPAIASLTATVMLLLVLITAGSIITAARLNLAAAHERQARQDAVAAQKRAEDSARSEHEARTEAERAAGEAEAVVEYLIDDMIVAAQPASARGRDTTVREVLDSARLNIAKAFADQPSREAAVRTALGQAYLALGQYEEAREHAAAALDIRRRTLGADHPDTHKTSGELGLILGYLGHFDEAQQLLDATYAALEQQLGPDHAETLQTLNNLAWLLEQQGKLKEAEQVYLRTYNARRETLGDDNLTTLEALNNLAVVKDKQGQYKAAQHMYEQAMVRTLRTLGPGHPRTLSAMGSLAANLYQQGKFEQAEQLNKQVLEQQMGVLGRDHPITLSTMHSLAVMLSEAGKQQQAEQYYRQAHEAQVRVLGPLHPDTLESISGLAGLLTKMNRYAEAAQCFQQLVAARQATLGPRDPLTVQTMASLASAQTGAGQHEAAEEVYREVITWREERLGEAAAETLEAKLALADNLTAQSRFDEAQQLYEPVLDVLRGNSTADSAMVQATLQSLAVALQEQSLHQQAVPLLRELFEAQQRAEQHGSRPANMTSVLAMLGWALSETGQAEEAEPLLRQCVDLRRASLPEHWLTANTESLLGGCLTELARYDEAEELLLDSYNQMKAAPDVIARRVLQAVDRLVHLYSAWGKEDEAKRWQALRDTIVPPPATASAS